MQNKRIKKFEAESVYHDTNTPNKQAGLESNLSSVSAPNTNHIHYNNVIKQSKTNLTPSNVLALQRTIGNKAVNKILSARTQSIIPTQPPIIQRVHENLIEQDGINVNNGEAATSWSIAGNSRKPLAIIKGTLLIDHAPRNVEVHVHLAAHNPLSEFTGANVRFEGDDAGFAYWQGGTVANIQWLKNVLDAGLPDWSKKSTWEAADPKSQIVWMPAPGAGWVFQEALNRANRRANLDYKVEFLVSSKNQGATTQKKDAERLCGPRVKASVSKFNRQKRTVTLTYEHEQAAFEQWPGDEQNLLKRWPNSTFTFAPKNSW